MLLAELVDRVAKSTRTPKPVVDDVLRAALATIEESAPGGVSGEVAPLRRIEHAREVASRATPADGPPELPAALAEARERGRALAARLLAGPEMLSSDAFAERIGVSRETVRQKLARHEVLGLAGAKRGWRFPSWQVSEDGQLLPGLPRLFAVLGGHPWTVYRFLLQHHPALDGATALDALRRGRIAEVLQAAASTGRRMA
jgi:hypothetical protein